MKTTITKAAARLEDLGIQLIRGLPYDMERMTARYLIREADGSEREVTSAQIAELIS